MYVERERDTDVAVTTARKGARTVSFEMMSLSFGVGKTRRRVLARSAGQLSTSSPLTHPPKPYHLHVFTQRR